MAIALEPGQEPDGSTWRHRFARWCLYKEMRFFKYLSMRSNQYWPKAPWRKKLIELRADRIKRWHRGEL